MLTERFPPAGGVGVIRILKFVKFLARTGWSIRVLTTQTDERSESMVDSSFLDQLPSAVSIIRTRTLPPFPIHERSLRWIPVAFLRLARMIRKRRPDILLITGGPFFVFGLGALVRRLYRIPYVLDYRDAWGLAYRGTSGRLTLKHRISGWLIRTVEPRALASASAVVFAHDRLRERYDERFALAARSVTIPNGFDVEDYPSEIQPDPSLPRGAVVYLGKFRRREAFHSPVTLFRAIRRLRDQGNEISFWHLGAREPEVEALATQEGIEGACHFLGWKPYAEALAIARTASVLVAIGSETKQNTPTKLYDYVGCARPILVLADADEEMVGLKDRLPQMTWSPVDDAERAAETLHRLLAIETIPAAWCEASDRFSRAAQADVLGSLLMRIVQEEQTR